MENKVRFGFYRAVLGPRTNAKMRLMCVWVGDWRLAACSAQDRRVILGYGFNKIKRSAAQDGVQL